MHPSIEDKREMPSINVCEGKEVLSGERIEETLERDHDCILCCVVR